MKITVEHTDCHSRSDYGLGRVWTGTTDQGTPLKVLICGMQSDSDDPAMVERFDREHDALPAFSEVCPDCGEPMVEHQLVSESGTGVVGEARVDMYEVMARMLIGFGDSKLPIPKGETAAGLAARLRERLPRIDKEYHDDLLRAAHAVTMYVVERVMAAQGIAKIVAPGSPVAGHA
jgi:hypothetical protein